MKIKFNFKSIQTNLKKDIDLIKFQREAGKKGINLIDFSMRIREKKYRFNKFAKMKEGKRFKR